MKITLKKSFAVILALVMCVSVLFGMNLSAFAADTNTVTYVKDGNYVYNWGQREAEATFLSPMAIAFYQKNNANLSELAALSGASSKSDVPYSALYKSLYKLMSDNHKNKTSYDGTKALYKYTDCENNNKSTISTFYSGKQVTSSWDNAATWNREHTWPNSKSNSGSSYKTRETDIIMLRPATPSNNSSRGNTAYGESSSYFNPNKFVGTTGHDVRGDAARAILYVYVRWGGDENHDGALNYMWGTSGVIESPEILLKWMEEDPVDTWEMGRNDATESITGTRNVFIDYPELAFELFETAVPNDYNTPSDGKSAEGTTGTGGSTGDNQGSTGGDTGNSGNGSTAPAGNIVFELGANGEATHKDGSEKATYSQTVDGYTLNITGGTKCYTGAFDATGNSAIKMGTGSAAGSFSLKAPDDVIKVIFNVAGYKSTAAKLSVNGTAHTVSTLSNNGAYTAIEVDTTTTKNISFATVSGGYRCMINSITFVVAGSSEGEDTSGDTVFVDSNDVVVNGSTNAFPEGTTVTAVQLTSGDNFDKVDTALNGVASKFTAYDLTATCGGAATQINNGKSVTLTLDIPDGYDSEKVHIVYISDEGEVEILDSTVDSEAGTVSTVLTHFSLYAVIEEAEPAADDGGSSGGSTTETVEVTAKLDFSVITNRITSTTNQQVWTENGVTFTNNKGTSTSALYTTATDHTRIYKGNKLVVDFEHPITKMVFTTTGSSYTTLLQSTLTSSGLGTVSVSGNVITVVLTTPSTSVTFEHTNNASRIKSLEITALASGDSGDDEEEEEETFTVSASANDNAMGTVTTNGNVITATPKAGYKVADYNIKDGTATVDRDGNVFTVTPTSNVVIEIIFELIVEEPTGGYYVKVESNLTDWSGDYLIVYEDGNVAFNGSLGSLDANLNNLPVVIDNKTIEATATRDAAKFTITKQADGTYTVKSASGYYIGHSSTSAGLLNNKTTTYKNTITFENGVAKILGTSGFALQFNAASGTERFRYYNGTQKNIALYKYVESLDANATITATVNDETMGSATVTGNVIFATANTGYEIVGYTIVSGSATVTQEGGMFTVDASGEVTIRINFAAAKNTVTFVERNTKSTITATTGTTITLPSAVGSNLSNEVFDGWLIEGTEQKFDAGTQYTVTSDVTFVAQFKAVEGEGGEGGEAVDTDLTLTFDSSKTNRTEFSTSKQVWAQNGITLTNNKATSTNNVADYGGPARFYANSEIIVSCKNMVKIVFNANTTGYATALKNSISGATVSGKVVTIEFENPCDVFTITKLTAQTRIDSMVVTTREIAVTATPVGAITGAQVNVGADLSMNFYASLKNIAADANVLLRVTMSGETIDIPREASKTINGEFIFTFDGIAPQAMTSAISAELILIADGEEIKLDAIENYSVKQNALNLLAAYANDEALSQFIVDMLYYGAEAQKYTGYNTGSLANAGISGTPSSVAPTEEDKMTLITTDAMTNDSPYFRAASVYFDGKNKLIIKIGNADGATLKVNGEPAVITNGTYTIEDILATQFGDVYTFELLENGEVVQTLTYSINAYAYSKWENSSVSALAQALYKYGVSAKAYADSIK